MKAKPLTVGRRWRMLLAWLRREFPPNRPVRVRRRELTEREDFGETGHHRHGFEISIKCHQCWALTRDTLLHEWAHVLTWTGNDDDDHGPEWGLVYAKIYRRYVAWNFGRGSGGANTNGANGTNEKKG